MQYSFAKACLLALATTTSVLAQIPGFNVLTAPSSNEVLTAGEKFTIKWTPSDPAAPITLLLMQGKNAQGLEIAAEPIAKSIDSGLGKFEWSVPTSAPFAAYGILLQLDSDTTQFQYSNPFTIAGGEGGDAETTTGPSEGTISISASEPTQTSAKSTKTVEVSQISTAPTSSTTKALSTTSKAPEPTTTSTEEEEPTSTVVSVTEPATTEAPSTTLATSVAPVNSTEAPTTPPTATPTLTGAAGRNAVVGGGILGAMVMVFALL